jgi:hypothetical protein
MDSGLVHEVAGAVIIDPEIEPLLAQLPFAPGG